MSAYMPEPLPAVLAALRDAMPDASPWGSPAATIADVKRQMDDGGKGIAVAAALRLLVSLGHATVDRQNGGKVYRPTAKS